jgi:hypothetical protein
MTEKGMNKRKRKEKPEKESTDSEVVKRLPKEARKIIQARGKPPKQIGNR